MEIASPQSTTNSRSNILILFVFLIIYNILYGFYRLYICNFIYSKMNLTNSTGSKYMTLTSLEPDPLRREQLGNKMFAIFCGCYLFRQNNIITIFS